MKKVLLFVLVACAILAGCKKKDSNNPTTENLVPACVFKIHFSDFLNGRCVWEIYINGEKVASLNNGNDTFKKMDFDNSKTYTIETKLYVDGDAEDPTDTIDMSYGSYEYVGMVNQSTGLSGINVSLDEMSLPKIKPESYQKYLGYMETALNLEYTIANGKVTKEGEE